MNISQVKKYFLLIKAEYQSKQDLLTLVKIFKNQTQTKTIEEQVQEKKQFDAQQKTKARIIRSKISRRNDLKITKRMKK